MGLGDIASMMYLSKALGNGNNEANRMRGKYNDLVNSFNELLEENNGLRDRGKELLDDVNGRAGVIRKLLKERSDLQVEREGLNQEIEPLKKTLAKWDTWIGEQVERNTDQVKKDADQKEWNERYVKRTEKQKEVFASLNSKINELTAQNSSLENDLAHTKQELTQRVFVGETIRRGMHHIPVEHRVKAAAESYVRHPDVSQATLNPDMPDEMKADIEMFIGLAMFPESGDKRVEVGSLYDQAKEGVKEDMAKSDKVFQKLIEIRKDLEQQAIDKGEDPGKVPDIWTIQAEMKQNLASGAKVTVQEDIEESRGPRR